MWWEAIGILQIQMQGAICLAINMLLIYNLTLAVCDHGWCPCGCWWTTWHICLKAPRSLSRNLVVGSLKPSWRQVCPVVKMCWCALHSCYNVFLFNLRCIQETQLQETQEAAVDTNKDMVGVCVDHQVGLAHMLNLKIGFTMFHHVILVNFFWYCIRKLFEIWFMLPGHWRWNQRWRLTGKQCDWWTGTWKENGYCSKELSHSCSAACEQHLWS